MKPSRHTLYGLLCLCLGMLQSMYTAFYYDQFVRRHLSSVPFGSLPVKSPHGTDGRETKGPRPTMAVIEGDGGGPWTGLFCLCVAQAVYAVYSSLGDLGFECVGDLRLWAVVRRRLSRLSVCGPLLGLCFVLMWSPPRLPLVPHAVLFTLLQAFFDALCSYCEAGAGARPFLADGGEAPHTLPLVSDRDRYGGGARSTAWTLAGSGGVVVASVLYESAPEWGLGGFRWAMLFWGVLSGGGLVALDHFLPRPGDGAGGSALNRATSPPRARGGSPPHANLSFGGLGSSGPKRGEASHFTGSATFEPAPPWPQSQRLLHFASQTLGRSSMKVVMGVGALQAFSCTITTHFFSLFLALVCSHSMAPSVRACGLLLSFVLPPAVAAALATLYASAGKKSVVSLLFLLRLGVGVATVTLAVESGWEQPSQRLPSSLFNESTGRAAHSTTLAPGAAARLHSTASFLFALLLFLDRVLAETVGCMQHAILADVCDEDTIIFGRARPMAAAIHVLVAAAARPARTAALLLTCAFLVAAHLLPGTAFTTKGVSAREAALAVAFVGCCSVLTSGAMLLLWHRRYNLEGKHLQFIHMAMRKRSEDEEVEQV